MTFEEPIRCGQATKEKEQQGPERCDKQLGEEVVMATKVVKSFKEKVINTVKCSGEFQYDKDRIFSLDLMISKFLVTLIRAFWGSDGASAEIMSRCARAVNLSLRVL